MNGGPSKEGALRQARANAEVTSRPWFLHKWGGVWWIEKVQHKYHTAAVLPDAAVYEISPSGTWTRVEPQGE